MARESLTLLAPLPPYRGGIARHSNALLNALAGRDDLAVHAESFARLYPAFLYPGENSKDASHDGPRDICVFQDLDTLNPLSWRKVAQRIVRRGGTLAIPSWTFFTAPCLGWIARHVRRHSVKVVMIVHNVGDHESAGWKDALTRWQLAGADGFVTHSAELEQQLRAAGLTQPCSVIEHPPYSDFPEAKGSLPREHALELLCFGLVRPYKGVDLALQALAESGLSDVRLTVAGEIWEGEDELRRLADDERVRGKVEFRNSYQSDSDAAELYARADALLLPYRSVTGSGVLAMAQHYRCPIVASALPPLVRAIERDGLGWTFATGDSEALAGLLVADVTRNSCEMKAGAMTAPDASGWSAMASAIMTQSKPD